MPRKYRCTDINRTVRDHGSSVRCRNYTDHPSGLCPPHRDNPLRPSPPPRGPRTSLTRRLTPMAQATLADRWPLMTWDISPAAVRCTLIAWQNGPTRAQVYDAIAHLLPINAQPDPDRLRVLWQRPGRRAWYPAVLLSRSIEPSTLAAAARTAATQQPSVDPRELAATVDEILAATPDPELTYPTQDSDRALLGTVRWTPATNPRTWLQRAIRALQSACPSQWDPTPPSTP